MNICCGTAYIRPRQLTAFWRRRLPSCWLSNRGCCSLPPTHGRLRQVPEPPQSAQDEEDSMLKKLLVLVTFAFSVYLTGCATVPMAPTADDQLRKQFSSPGEGKAGLYIYRNSTFGAALTKVV